MREFLVTAFLIMSAVLASAEQQVPKSQTMAACHYDILKAGYDAFRGHKMAMICMKANGYEYDAGMPNCRPNALDMAFDADCYTTIAVWEEITKVINECTIDIGKHINSLTDRVAFETASEACYKERGYENGRPIGYGLDD